MSISVSVLLMGGTPKQLGRWHGARKEIFWSVLHLTEPAAFGEKKSTKAIN